MHDFTRILRAKGYTAKDVAKRWGLKSRAMTNLCSRPTQRDWDALDGLPQIWTRYPDGPGLYWCRRPGGIASIVEVREGDTAIGGMEWCVAVPPR